MRTVVSREDLEEKLGQSRRVFLLVHKKGAEQSDVAYANLEKASSSKSDTVFSCDVTQVHDVHSHFGITTVPVFLSFENGRIKQALKGAQTLEQYQRLLEGTTGYQPQNGKQKMGKSVIVYTTPTCSWCNTLKSYLRQNNISFKEIDVSRDEKMAQKMVQKSGQQGVPQTDVNGQMIIGFNKEKIDQLLEIK